MYVVVVRFEIAPAYVSAFEDRVRQQARNSLANEPGCRRFDVAIDPENPRQILLYELYDDRAAFDAHLTTPHFADFNAAAEPMITSKSIEFFTLLETIDPPS
ncbi:MAG: antibiotic biosynthesis monooxygenase [Neomegalonema sp.]|nr:antibiotic biosynthesis monooxygenase [Neomegalonema sp.]